MRNPHAATDRESALFAGGKGGRVPVGDSLLIQKLIKRLKLLKTCFSPLTVANIRGYCGETIFRISPELSLIFSPFYETSLAQKQFIVHSRVI
jgi:hypothetical protein